MPLMPLHNRFSPLGVRTRPRAQVTADAIQAAPGLVAYFRGDSLSALADGATLTAWTDSSGHGYDATPQVNRVPAPFYAAAAGNGHGAVRFAGGHFLRFFPPNTATRCTCYLVATPHSGSNSYLLDGKTSNTPALISGWGGAAYEYYTGSDRWSFGTAAAGYHVLDFSVNSSNMLGYRDGTQVRNSTPVTNLIGANVGGIGASDGTGYFYTGYVACLAVFDAVHDSTTAAGIRAFLKTKYATP